MADEDVQKQQVPEYEEPSLTDLEDVAGGGTTICYVGIVENSGDGGLETS